MGCLGWNLTRANRLANKVPPAIISPMIVTCPSCEAQYILPDEAVGSRGRRVKCSSCAYTWLQSSEAEEVPIYADAEVSQPQQTQKQPLVDMNRFMPQAAPESMSRPAIIGALSGLAFFAVTLGVTIAIRSAVASGWPPSTLLFEKVGLAVPAPGAGVVFEDVTAALDKDFLTVKGKIVNDTAHNIKLPDLIVRVSGGQGWLKDWPIPLYDKIMPPGESAGFDYTLSEAPADGTDVVVRFTE
jgi:predicted Zn finger-like uncharacterized protein